MIMIFLILSPKALSYSKMCLFEKKLLLPHHLFEQEKILNIIQLGKIVIFWRSHSNYFQNALNGFD